MNKIHEPFFTASEMERGFLTSVACLINGVRMFRRSNCKYELYFEKNHLYLRLGVTNSITEALHFSYNT